MWRRSTTRQPSVVYSFVLGCIVSTTVFLATNHYSSYNHQHELYEDGIRADEDWTDFATERSPRRRLNDMNGWIEPPPQPPQQQLMSELQQPQQAMPLYSYQSSPTLFVLGVFSTLEEGGRREKLREYIFRNPNRVDPRLCALNEYLAWQREGVNQNNICQVLYTFVVGGGDPATTPAFFKSNWDKPLVLNHEQVQSWYTQKELPVESDVTYLNVRENMNKGKTPAWFKYVTDLNNSIDNHNIRLDYVAKLDSDTLISIPDLVHMINHDLPQPPPPTQSSSSDKNDNHLNVYGGILCDQEVACGLHNSTQKKQRCLDVLHGRVYMTGQFYFVSADLAAHVAGTERPGREQEDQPQPYSEDVDFALVVHASNRVLKLVVLNNRNVFWLHNTKTDAKMDSKYVDYFVRLRQFPKYTFWSKPNWWS